MVKPSQEKANVENEALDALPLTSEKLEELREEIKADFANDQDEILQYCELHRIPFFENWTDVDSLDGTQMDHLGVALSKMGNPDEGKTSGTKLFEALSGSNQEEAQGMLSVLVDLLNRRQTTRLGVEKKLDVVSGDVAGGALAKTVEHLGDRFDDNPLVTVLAGTALVWLAAKAWNTTIFEDKENGKPGIPWFQWLVKGGGSVLAINHLAGPIFNGRSLFEAMQGMEPDEIDEHIESMESHFPDGSTVEKQDLRTLLEMGPVPFKYLIDAYRPARKKGQKTIDMKKLGRRLSKYDISASTFRESAGPGLYSVLEGIIGTTDDDLARARERYAGSTGNWTTLRVTIDKYNDDPDFAAKADELATIGAGSAGSKKRKKRPKSSVSSKAEFQKEFRDTDGFKELDLKIGKDKKAEVMGFKIEYDRDVQKDKKGEETGVTKYDFKDGGTTIATVEVGDGEIKDEETQQKTAVDGLKKAMKARMAGELKKKGITKAPEWDDSKKSWSVPGHVPAAVSGYSLDPMDVEIEIVDGKFIRFTTAEVEGSTKTIKELEAKMFEEHVMKLLRKDPDFEAAFGRGLPLRLVDAPKKGTPGLLKVAGAEIKVELTSSGELNVKSIKMTEAFANKKVDQARKSDEFTKVFEGLRHSGEELSQWRKGIDFLVLRFREGDNYNHHWTEMVAFKEEQILADYRDALMKIKPGQNPAEALQEVFEDSIEQDLEELDDLQRELSLAEDEATYDEKEREFFLQGLDSEVYKDRFESFYRQVDGLQLPGATERSNPIHQNMVFQLQRIWFDHTRELQNPTNGEFTDLQLDYMKDLEDEMMDVMAMAQRKDPNWIQKYFRSGIDEAEFKNALPGMKSLPKYKKFQEREGRSEDFEKAIPQLRGVGGIGYTHEIDKATGLLTITFEDTPKTVWTFERKSPGKFEMISLALSPEMVDGQVNYASRQPEFTQPFKDLENIFEAMDNRAHPFQNILAGRFEEVFNGEIADNRWKSLVEYKRQELLDKYRTDLIAVTDPNKWGEVSINAAPFAALAQTLNLENTDRLKPGEEYTRQRFEKVYDLTQVLGYKTPEYKSLMVSLRDDIRVFDLEGMDVGANRNAEDVLNLAMLLQHEHTREIDGHAKFGSDELNYFRYVQVQVMTVLRLAHANNTLFDMLTLDNVIRREEIPKDLGIDIKSFDEWNADKGSIYKDPLFINDIESFRQQLKEEKERESLDGIRAEFDSFFNDTWNAVLAKADHEDIDQGSLKFYRGWAETSRDRAAMAVFLGEKPKKRMLSQLESRIEKAIRHADKDWDWVPGR
jgi:hypothetical protein